MSRKPIIGNVVYYQISFDTNGKPRAVNARIEGVGQALTLLPLEQVSKATRPSSAKESPAWFKKGLFWVTQTIATLPAF